MAAFAVVSLRSQANDFWSIEWTSAASRFRQAYGEAVDRGIQFARAEHKRRGGTPQKIEVLGLEEVPADTRADAVYCAATIATWKALGNPESEIGVDVDDEDNWHVRFLTT
jgi:hypothetical protein